MNMKRLLTVVCVAMLTIAASAQITWNVKAGAGVSTMWGGDVENTRTHIVAKIGVGLEKPLTRNLSLMPSLEVAVKGFKNGFDDYKYGWVKNTVDIFYAQIPILLAYRLPIAKEWNLVLKAGPYVAYSFYNHWKQSRIIGEPLSDELDVKKIDVGVDAGVDFEYHRFVFGAEAEMGFLSLDKHYNIKNLAFYATVGYKF